MKMCKNSKMAQIYEMSLKGLKNNQEEINVCAAEENPTALSGLRNETRQEVTKPALPLMTTGGPLQKPVLKPTAEIKTVQSFIVYQNCVSQCSSSTLCV